MHRPGRFLFGIAQSREVSMAVDQPEVGAAQPYPPAQAGLRRSSFVQDRCDDGQNGAPHDARRDLLEIGLIPPVVWCILPPPRFCGWGFLSRMAVNPVIGR